MSRRSTMAVVTASTMRCVLPAAGAASAAALWRRAPAAGVAAARRGLALAGGGLASCGRH